MKLCVFCGTFNPIHSIHIKMAKYIQNHFNFDKILFIPAYRPPHKDINSDSLPQDRYNMVQLAIKDEVRFSISDLEFKRDKKSYTCDTIEILYKIYPEIEGKISFIIGTDAFLKIESWYNTEKLKNLVKFIVFKRENQLEFELFERLKAIGYDFEFVEMPFNDVSSTMLRNKINQGEALLGLVSPEVEKYIKEKGLYL